MSEYKSDKTKSFINDSYLGAAGSWLMDQYNDSLTGDDNHPSNSVSSYFQHLKSESTTTEVSEKAQCEKFSSLTKQQGVAASAQVTPNNQGAVDALIDGYRRWGHYQADLDPTGQARPVEPRLSLAHYRLESVSMDETFLTNGLMDCETASLGAILARLKDIYCRTTGFQYSYINHPEERSWLERKIETLDKRVVISDKLKRSVMKELIGTEGLEKFLDTRYPGQVRFSVEGNDTIIPMLRYLVEQASQSGVAELIIGMAHRARLNVLINVLGKKVGDILKEFEGEYTFSTTGDVKYHLGHSVDVPTESGSLHLSLAFNPSHLEAVDPVVQGIVRSKQDRNPTEGMDYAIPVLMHGDSSFIGQGIVAECFNGSRTDSFNVGGTIHIVINNQIGFTTNNSLSGGSQVECRSSTYCTDVAKIIEAPIIHVNANDPEAVLRAMNLAYEYRMQFHKDVVLDLIGFRRKGHNESDEPRATQPDWYKAIDALPPVANLYAAKLLQEKVVTEEELKSWQKNYRSQLEEGACMVGMLRSAPEVYDSSIWKGYDGAIDSDATIDTRIPHADLVAITESMKAAVPATFTMQKQVKAIYNNRYKMWAGQMPLDWGSAEMLAYASLLKSGFSIRINGQDAQRGTFFHRHAVVHDANGYDTFQPLLHVGPGQGNFFIYNSTLCEEAAMGFDYGYSTADPKSLVIWEAQFGDFYNNAQGIVDQFISSAWQKWNRMSGLVMYLPHGYEGKGPEHSSARLERFLQLCAQDNMSVCMPTTPAQMFHLLRRQMLAQYRVPLVVFTPKSLLRHKGAVSDLSAFYEGGFQPVIDEGDTSINKASVKRVIMCSGKVYYELLAARDESNRKDIAIIRLEQFYPFPSAEIKAVFSAYKEVKHVVWCQEEPKNQGAWYMIRHLLEDGIASTGASLTYEGRPAMAAPAAGSILVFREQQKRLVQEALG